MTDPGTARDAAKNAVSGEAPAGARYDDLRALVINCTLKRSPERSNTQGLIDRSTDIMAKHGVSVEVRARSTTTSRPVCGRT